jgi:hypothetical protein
VEAGGSVDRRSRGVGEVSFGEAMGLLDDAIREHLELKRLRGADPSEVARDERAALGPPVAEDDEYDFAESAVEPDDELGDVDEPDRSRGTAERHAGADMPSSSEETMEVDMRTIIDAELVADDADLELNGETMAANAAAYSLEAGRVSGEWGVDPRSADWEERERSRRPRARAARALGFGAGPAVEGSLP